jgi:hypothetical protein
MVVQVMKIGIIFDAQRGKAIDEMAYRMLYYDANELISMLK